MSHSAPREPFGAAPPGEVKGLAVKAAVRVLATTTFLLVVYFTVPLSRDLELSAGLLLVLGVAGFSYALFHQVRRILDAPYPTLRVVETLTTVVLGFIIVFALVYVALSQAHPTNFSEPISRLSGLYFTVTVLSTVGFGDITDDRHDARAIVTVQMLADLIIVGFVVRIVIGAGRLGVERRRAEAALESNDEG